MEESNKMHKLRTIAGIRTEQNARLQMQAMMLGGPITYVSQEEGERHDGPQAQTREPLNRASDMWKREALGK